MHHSLISFRKIVTDETAPAGKQVETEIIELRKPDGTIVVLPAADVDPASGQRWCDVYGDKYGAFKRDPNAERAALLEREIAERQAELDALRAKPDKPPEPVAAVEPVIEPDEPDEPAHKAPRHKK